MLPRNNTLLHIYTNVPLCSSSPGLPTNSQDVEQVWHFKLSKIPTSISSPQAVYRKDVGAELYIDNVLKATDYVGANHAVITEISGHIVLGRINAEGARRAPRTTDRSLAGDLGPTTVRGRTESSTSELNQSRLFVITQSWQCCQERLPYGSKNGTCSGD